MSDALDRALDLLDQGKDFARIAAEMMPPGQREVLRRCACVRAFDRELFEAVIRLVPSELENDSHFERVIASPLVQPVPRTKASYCLAEDARSWLLGSWDQEGDRKGLISLRRRLLHWYEEEAKDPIAALYQQARLDPVSAWVDIDRLFHEALARFDIPQCDELLGLYPDITKLPKEIRDLLESRRATLSARILWDEDYYRTAGYLERTQLTADLKRLMETDDPRTWVYQVHAAGGTGKTMFVRWAIARWCLPRGIPCARIDFDFANPSELASQPRSLVLQIARQWNKQLPQTPLDPLIGRLSTSGAESGEPLEHLASALTLPEKTNALIILDTLEEVLIPHRPQLIDILAHLSKLHAYPAGGRIRLLLSGRYDLRKRLGEAEAALLGPAPIHRKIFRFKDREARRYLVEMRGLDDDEKLQAAVDRSRGNPLKLWLFSEIIKGEPELTADDIRANVSVEVEYLIRRVVLRIGQIQKDPATGEIPDLYKGLRWVLRYGVVPRRLTLEFLLADPIRRRLQKEMAGKEPEDDTQRGIERLSVAQEAFPRSTSPPDIKTLWDELKKYVSGSSWVRLATESAEPETLVFTPDVLKPMRDLLLKQEPALFFALHSEALDYFQARANQAQHGSKQRAHLILEMVYHDFQRQGEDAGSNWRTLLLAEEFRDQPSYRKLLAAEVVGRSYIEDDDPPRPIVRNDGKRMIGSQDLAFAYFHAARAAADIAVAGASDPAREWTDALSTFRRYEKAAAELADPAHRFDPVEVRILGAVIQANVPGGDRSAALAELRAIETEREHVPDEVFREEARLLEQAKDPDAERVYKKWLAQEQIVGPVQAVEIQELLAMRQVASDHLADALATCDEAIGAARSLGPEADQLRTRLDLFRKAILLGCGRPQEVIDALLTIVYPTPTDTTLPPVHTAASWFLRAGARLAQLDPHHALRIHREARDLRRKVVRAGTAHLDLIPEKPAELQQRALIAGTVRDYRRALDALSTANAEWLKLNKPQHPDHGNQALAESASLTLHELGDLTGTASLLGQSRPTTEDTPAKSEPLLRIELLRAELVARLGDLSRAQGLVDDLLTACRDSPPRFRVQAALTGLALGGEPPPVRYFEALALALAQITPGTARLVLLEPLERVDLLGELPAGLVDRFLALIPDLSDPSLAPRDRAVLSLRRVEVLRVVGRNGDALAVLTAARESLLGPTNAEGSERMTRFPLAGLLRAEDRLGQQAEACQRAIEQLPAFAAEFSRDQERVLVATAWVDQAERAFVACNDPALDEAIAEARRRVEQVEIPGMTWLRVRLYRLRADVAGRRGFFDDQARHQQSARGFEEILGIAVRTATASEGDKEVEELEVSGQCALKGSAGATASPLPLLPIHSAYSMALDWKAGEGLSVTTSPPAGQNQTFPLGFLFLNQLGLGQNPSPSDGVASVPMWPVATFHERWEKLADQMATLFLTSGLLAEIDSRQAPQAIDVRLDIDSPMLSQFPWEFVRRPEGEQSFISALPGVRHLYRSADLSGGDPSTVRWVQSVIRLLFDRGITVDGADSPRLRNAIRSFQAEQGLEVTGMADAKTRWALDRSWRAASGQKTRSVLLITSDPTAFSFYVTPGGSRIQLAYQQCGYDVIVVSSQGPDLSTVAGQIENKTLCFIHLGASLSVMTSLGIVFALAPAGQPASGQDNLTPKRLDEFLKSLPESELKPVIVLDPPQPPSPFEAVLQLFMRNAFAAELFRLGSAPVVLATGLAELGTPEHVLVDLIRAASEGHSLGEVLAMIRRHVLQVDQPKISDLLWPIGTALFAHDPDTRAPGAEPIDRTATAPVKREYVSRNVYALLVGIDKYPASEPSLGGCVNDIKEFESYLMDRVGKAQGVGLSVHALLNEQATRQAVIDRFRNHLGKAAKGDVAIFYFSGRGSLEQTPPELWHLEPGLLDKTLVCHDSRQPGNWDLADKELAKLIDEVSAREPHLVLFVDSCYSGSGTRDGTISPRRMPFDGRARPIESFLVSPDELEPVATGKSSSGWQLKNRKSRYVMFTACRDEQEAREYVLDGVYRGAFSFFLSETLKSATGVPTYREVFTQVHALVSSLALDQTPQVICTRADDLDVHFLDGTIQPVPVGSVVRSPNSAPTLADVLEGDTLQRLKHEDRWTQTARLSNPSSSIQPGDVEMAFLVNSKAVPAPILLDYESIEGRQIAPTFQISLTNKSRVTLYCAILELTQRFEINAGWFQGGCTKIEPGSTVWAHGGDLLKATVPDDLWQQGVIEYEYLLKLIVCTREFNARLLELPPLDLPRQSRGPARDPGLSGRLNQRQRNPQTRDVAGVQTGTIDDWRTSEVAFTTIRRQPAFAVPGVGSSIELIRGVTLQGHPGLTARVRLSTEPLALRELAGVRLPRLLTEDPSVCVPLILASPPGSFPGLSVLEFVGVNDPSVVTQEQPLRLTVPWALEANEFVVAVAYDGESFLPAGQVEARRADETVIRIDRLPSSAVNGRSAKGPSPIFFEKVISRKPEEEFSLPLLAAAEVGPGDTMTRFGDAAEVRRRVARANNILLFVPGIVGDSQSMVSSVRLAKLPDGQPLINHYDLVLIFEYDPLNTKIDVAARALKQQMEATGLGPGHRKRIDIVAHSTGGLLARWYIEREGENRAVRKLIMLGTPNGGWPWPRFDDWATVVLSLGLNQFTTIAWPASAIGSLAALIEHGTVVPEEIRRFGRIIEGLQSTKDPEIPYTLLVGTASVNRPTSISAASAWGHAIDRLISRIVSEEFLLNRVSPIVLEVPSDIALTATRIKALPSGRKQPCTIRTVACDHLSYFTSEAGLKALAEALAP